ncbi:MAG: CpaF/VirB11 family protein [Actinobacteria bacterium]|nr:CpaF/VirB11 family protein [Actinomycetota bacterium]
MSEPEKHELMDLPMFGSERPTGGRRAGRVRGGFRLPGEPEPAGRVPAAPPLVSRVVPIRPALPASAFGSASPSVDGVDWAEVARFRGDVAKRLPGRVGGGASDRAEEEAAGWSVIRQLLEEDTASSVARTGELRSPEAQEALAQAIFDSVFRLGRLQPLVDDPAIENILVYGCDRVVVEYADGSMRQLPPVADSDADLVGFIAFVASRADNPRSFTPAHPSLNLTLADGSRLAASLETGRVSLVIRRHRIRRVTLADLVEWGSLSEVMADFLRAAVRARKSIVVSGAQGAGKTTLVRALCAEIPRMEIVGTFESERELFLPEIEGQHAVVFDWEMRAGSGERAEDGSLAGRRTTGSQVTSSFRFRADRQIVGEVLGAEAMDMIKVMESGTGSISTTHAANARLAVHKLITCAMEAGPHVSHDLVSAKLAATLDLVVQMHSEVTPIDDFGQVAQKRRYVSEIVEVTPGEWPRGISFTTVFRRLPGQPGVADTRPDSIWDDLVAAGLDEVGFEREAAEHHTGGLR